MTEFTIDTRIRSYAWEELSEQDRRLWEVAKQKTQDSHSPYSHFCVGAAALLADGTIVGGCNQ